jgi:L-fuculose-phosphate aldolase
VSDLREEVAAAARRLADEGLLIGTAGNVSALDPASGLLAITASGVVLAGCSADQVSLVDQEGSCVAGDLEPSSELGLHLAVTRTYGVGAVVHTHAPNATAIACVHDELPVLHYQQLGLGGAIRVAPYETFGTPALAAGVVAALEGRSAALMANHGAVTHGRSLIDAVENALLLEWCCRLFRHASALGTPRVLDDQQQLAVIEAAIARDYGTQRPARPAGGAS